MLEKIDNFFLSLNENKTVLFLIIIFLVIYAVAFNKMVTEKFINLYSNDLFKIIVFFFITYLTTVSFTIAFGLATITLLSLQIVTNHKIKNTILIENNL